MQLADGHLLRIESRPYTYDKIDWSLPDRPRTPVTVYDHFLVCSCEWETTIATRYGQGGESLQPPPLDDERVTKQVERHRRMVSGEKGIYECGCTKDDQPRGKRGAYCRGHGSPYIPLKPSTYKKPSMSALEVLDHLSFSYQPDEWAFFKELRLATGWNYGARDGINGEQRMDAFAFNTWPSKKHRRIAFEVKVSRGDFLSEIKDPSKRASAMLVSNQFFFVCPLGLVKKEEIPEDCGLIEIKPTGGRKFTVKAPHREISDPPMRFISSLLRAASRKAKA